MCIPAFIYGIYKYYVSIRTANQHELGAVNGQICQSFGQNRFYAG